MPRLAANVSMLFPELPFLERFAAAARAGFRYVEYQFPYEWPAAEVGARARAAGLEVVLHNFPLSDAQSKERGASCLPGQEAVFARRLDMAVEYARAARCPRLHCLAGAVPAGADRARMEATFVANLRVAARRLAQEGIDLLLEPLNSRTMPGYLLTGSAQAVRLLDELGEPNAFLQYDMFHMQIMEGDLAKTIERLLPRIGHLQLADVPDRHEPGTGEVNYPWLLAHIDRLGYRGFVGCEYNPKGDTAEGLKWAKPYL